MTKFIYKIRDKRNGNFFGGWYNFTAKETDAQEYNTEAGARNALDHFVHQQLGSKLYSSAHRGSSHTGITEENLKKWFPYDPEVVKVEVTYTESGVIDVSSTVRNMFISNKLQDTSYRLSRFWDNAIKKGYADEIEYIVDLKADRESDRQSRVLEARSQLRLLGIKTRTFREYQGMLGFYNRDQAFKARLTLDIADFIDITELKKELFS